ncbi:hypothetical protein [Ferruginibacter sp.]
MDKKINSTTSNFQDADDLNKIITLNIENFLKNHTREGANASQQNMAARRDSWNPLIMKNQNLDNSANQSSRV